MNRFCKFYLTVFDYKLSDLVVSQHQSFFPIITKLITLNCLWLFSFSFIQLSLLPLISCAVNGEKKKAVSGVHRQDPFSKHTLITDMSRLDVSQLTMLLPLPDNISLLYLIDKIALVFVPAQLLTLTIHLDCLLSNLKDTPLRWRGAHQWKILPTDKSR